jgi:hypothetical protein
VQLFEHVGQPVLLWASLRVPAGSHQAPTDGHDGRLERVGRTDQRVACLVAPGSHRDGVVVSATQPGVAGGTDLVEAGVASVEVHGVTRLVFKKGRPVPPGSWSSPIRCPGRFVCFALRSSALTVVAV